MYLKYNGPQLWNFRQKTYYLNILCKISGGKNLDLIRKLWKGSFFSLPHICFFLFCLFFSLQLLQKWQELSQPNTMSEPYLRFSAVSIILLRHTENEVKKLTMYPWLSKIQQNMFNKESNLFDEFLLKRGFHLRPENRGIIPDIFTAIICLFVLFAK